MLINWLIVPQIYFFVLSPLTKFNKWPQQRMQYLFLYSWITRTTALELHFTLHSIVCMKPRRFSATICWLFVPKNAHNWPIIAYTNSEQGFEMLIRALKVPKTIKMARLMKVVPKQDINSVVLVCTSIKQL